MPFVMSAQVVVRCRPLFGKELTEGRQRIVEMDQKLGQVSIRNPKPENQDQAPMSFTFDQVYDWNTTQREIFDITAAPIVTSVMDGYNGTIFCYGQTGSGKTHTMVGYGDNKEDMGIIPRAFHDIFNQIAERKERSHMVRASFLEIYNEEIRDLLSKDQTKRLDLRENVERGIYIDGLSTFTVSCPSELLTVLNVGNKNRTVGATKMNQDSSRSHSIFMITVESADKTDDAAGGGGGGGGGGGEEDNNAHIRVGKLNLVDLAGSERQSKTGATGVRLKEATKINLSLSALGNCISALVDGKSTHIPYRDSKLTRLLQDSLGGNTKTVMVANCGPADYNYDETMSTLRYANRAKNIQNKPKINEDPKDAMIREYQEKLAELKAKLEARKANHVPVKVVKKVVEVEVGEDKIAAVRAAMMAEVAQELEEKRGKAAVEKAKRAAEEKARKALEGLLKEAKQSEREKRAIQEALNKQHMELEAYTTQLEKERREQEELELQLNDIQSKVIDGGENLFEKLDELESEKERHERELEVQRRQAEEQERRLRDLARDVGLDGGGRGGGRGGGSKSRKDASDLGKKSFRSLEEEIKALEERKAEITQQIRSRETEINEVHHHQQLEREDMLNQIRELRQITKLRDLVMSWFIPPEWMSVIKERCYEDPTTEDWIIEGVELTGNNAKRWGKRNEVDDDQDGEQERATSAGDPSDVFLSYKRVVKGEDGETTAGGGAKKQPLWRKGKVAAVAGRQSRPSTAKAPGAGEADKEAAAPKARGLVRR